MQKRSSSPGTLLAILLLLGALAGTGTAHEERATEFPDGTGQVPEYRPMVADPHLVVCKDDSRQRINTIRDEELRRINLDLLAECDYGLIQKAVDALEQPATTIYLLPGVYKEKPHRDKPACAESLEPSDPEAEGAPVLSYEQQLGCPHAQNLIGILGDVNPNDGERRCDGPACKVQLEGTGDDAGDVVISGGFKANGNFAKLNGIRADRADGAYFKNFTIQLFEFNALYVLETDGFVIDEVVGRWNDEYAFLTFAVDHGLYKNCEGYGNGDSAIYPGSASDLNSESKQTGRLDRWAVEVTGCRAHHNALGYSGTAGNSVYVHGNRFYKNATGIVTDSVFPNHPGLPQDHAWFENNLIYSNNKNYYKKYVIGEEPTCDKKPASRGYRQGTVCPVIPAPVGTGLMIAGGNYNLVRGNTVFDNWRQGLMLFGVPAAIREEPDKGFDTSHFNFFIDNLLGQGPGGSKKPNGIDVWWDEQGEGNCWESNESSNGDVLWNPALPGTALPDCESGGSPGSPAREKQGSLAPCATYDRSDPDFRDPPGCDWFDSPSKPDQ